MGRIQNTDTGSDKKPEHLLYLNMKAKGKKLLEADFSFHFARFCAF